MSIEISLLILVTALLVLITAQLRAIAVMIRETLDGVEVPIRDAQPSFQAQDPDSGFGQESAEHTLTLVK